ncbi:MAG TPA: shikimate kinase [Acidobacteriaceae bacterium]
MSQGPPGPAALPRRIVLTGFMGAGKSTVGRVLAARLRWPFLDIDSLITARQNCTIARIFAEHGEPHFRRLEADTVAHVLHPDHEHRQAIVALGGGAIETEAVRNLLFAENASTPETVTIFLTAPLAELLARCRGPEPAGATREPAPVRPILSGPESPEDRLARRLPLYSQAHLTVDTSGIPPTMVVDRIIDWLSAYDPPHPDR